jgi:hypothetical protein
MPLAPIPIAGRLVPAAAAAVPAGFTLVDEPLQSGLPQPFPLLGDLVLVLAVPTGLALTWLDADPSALVSASAAELDPPPGPAGQPGEEVGSTRRAPARPFLRRAGETLAAVPLVAGLPRVLPDDGRPEPGALVRLVVLDWELRAGSLRGPANVGSRIRFAWRPADRGDDRFERPPPHPRVAVRPRPPDEEEG